MSPPRRAVGRRESRSRAERSAFTTSRPGQTSRHAGWSLRGGAAEARSSRRAGAAWCVSLACRSPQNSPRWGRARLGDDAACGQNEIPRKATTDSARSTRPRLTSPPSPPRPAPSNPNPMCAPSHVSHRTRARHSQLKALCCVDAASDHARRRDSGGTVSSEEHDSPLVARRDFASSSGREAVPPRFRAPTPPPFECADSAAEARGDAEGPGDGGETSGGSRDDLRRDSEGGGGAASEGDPKTVRRRASLLLARRCGERSAGSYEKRPAPKSARVRRSRERVTNGSSRGTGRARGGAVSTANAKRSRAAKGKRKRTTARIPSRFRGTSRRDSRGSQPRTRLRCVWRAKRVTW